ncbi:MAG: formate/nitrite transporter family protein [Pseudomonadota bacterium]
MNAPSFGQADEKRIADQQALRSDQIFEIVRRDGVEELERPATSLAWSALAAGLAIGFSVLAEAALLAKLPSETVGRDLIAEMGYTVGFIIVILSRLQLFTENTITPVLPICYAPTRANFSALARIWGIVFAANMLGTVLFGLFLMETPAISEELRVAVLEISRKALDGAPMEILIRGIGAGFLIAALVWILAHVDAAPLFTIFLVTYVIAICGFSHVIAGTVEATALIAVGEVSVGAAMFGFILPALIGNVIGGTALFTLIAYGQVRDEI